jgi:hypothetical protein
MRRVLWTLAAMVAAIAWNGAFTHLMERAGVPLPTANPIGIGMFALHCGSFWGALRLRSRLRATGTGDTRARFDRPGTMIAYRLIGALALALSVAVLGLLIAWVRPLFG